MIYPSDGRAVTGTDAIMRMEDVFDALREDLDRVEEVLLESLQSNIPLVSQVGHYVFQSGGKRMRPLLTILSSRTCGYSGSAHLRMAAVVELIHTATLLHDDVVDHADLRRGARSVNDLWNNETSILVGDFLFTRSFCMMVEQQDMRILDLMSRTCRLLAEGEIQVLVKSGDPAIQENDYLATVRHKTAVLFSAACRLGAILGERPEWEEPLAAYGMNLGMAFQLVDDVLDYAAEQEELGKTIGKDLLEGNVTLPMIRTLELCSSSEQGRLAEIIRARSQDHRHLQVILDAIQKYDGLEYTRSIARRYVEKAKACLRAFPDGRNKSALSVVADFVADRRN